MTDFYLSRAMDLHGDAVYRLALCRLQNAADAEDVYQDTFLKLFQQEDAEGWSEEKLKAWLLRVAINRCIDISRERRSHGCVDLDTIMAVADHSEEGCTEIWDAVSRLPEKQRTIFHLYYAEGYQTAEIGKILNIASATVRVNLNRARTALRKELRSHV